jgi:hypothetical protein
MGRRYLKGTYHYLKHMYCAKLLRPDPHGSALFLVGWFWIRIRIWNADPDLDPRGLKITHH